MNDEEDWNLIGALSHQCRNRDQLAESSTSHSDISTRDYNSLIAFFCLELQRTFNCKFSYLQTPNKAFSSLSI